MEETVSPVISLKWPAIGVLLIGLFIIALLGLFVHDSRLQYEERTAITTMSISQVLEQYIGAEIDKTDLALLSVADEIKREVVTGGAINRQILNEYIARQHKRMPYLYSLEVANVKGDIAYGVFVSVPLATVADRDYFIRLRNDRNAGMVIARPVVGRISGKWVLILARRLEKSDGSFGGVVYAGILLEHFIKSFSEINVGRHGAINLFDSELSTIARYPEPPGGNPAGKKLTSAEIRGLFERKQTSATYRTRANLDGIERIYSYRKISDYPLYILVGLAKDEYLAEWRKETAGMLALGALFFLVVLCLTWLLYRDITESKLAKEKLKTSNELLENIIEFLPDATFIMDNNKRIIAWNRAIEDMTGVRKGDIIGKDHYFSAVPFYGEPRPYLMDLIGIDNSELESKYMYVKKKGDALYAEVFTPALNNGKGAYVWAIASPLFDRSGCVIGVIESIRDITERKQVEEEREKLQAQLLQSQKMEAVGTLAGGIAHDFNNLLTAIIGYSDLILTELPEKHSARDKVRIVRDTGDKASDLVRRLLIFSRKQILEMKPVNLNEVVSNMSKIFGRTIGEDIELELDINKPVKNVLADAGQIEQILMNLVVNARDAMPNGGRLIIETDNVYLDEAYALMHSQLVKPGPYVTLSVTDNGAGMSHEVKEKIFEPFFTTKGAGRGTGLGLSTTYGIIEQHNGYICVYSEPGKGTTFKVYLSAIEEKTKEIKKDESSITDKGTETILVVDDQPLIRQFVIDVLQPREYKLFEADSGEEALKIAAQVEGKIDLLLTDLVMPGMKGSKLRKLFIERWPGIKVCLMSGYGDKEIFGEGMDDVIFIQKPLTPKKLVTKLREVLDLTNLIE